MTGLMAVLFDIDETLVHTGGAGARSWAWAFKKLHGVDADIAKYSAPGQTDQQVGRETFAGVLGREPSHDELGRIYASYLWHLADDIWSAKNYRVMDGVEETLSRMAHAGVIVGLVSGAMEGAARVKIGPGKLGRHFIFGAYGSDSADRGEVTRLAVAKASQLHGRDLDASEVAVVGDTPLDIQAAHAANATGVGVATGIYSVEQLQAANADHVLGSLGCPEDLGH
jgi:phosphoglycolate phosphatase